ncbi:MAG: RAMP superfamily CRISPR-associated protein [Treponemataceae bacterium]|nr:RAMP superfamily CRISPR-associated protein [Treponemataceae bacterium]
MKLEINLEVISAICVGSTADVQGIGVDKATARDEEGKLMIPGSTLKGRIRWECERIGRALGLEICNPPRPDNMCPHFWARKNEKTDRFCILCEIFGAPGRRSPLKFKDAILLKDERLRDTPVLQAGKSVNERRSFDAQIRPGVSISRSRRTAFSQRLFFVETSTPNAHFRFKAEIEGHLPSERHRGFLLAGIRALSFVGGGRSRGLGWVRTEECFLDGRKIGENEWKQFLKPFEEVTK